MKLPNKTWQGDDFEGCLAEVVNSRSDCFMKDKAMAKEDWIEKALPFIKSELQNVSERLPYDFTDDFFTADEWKDLYQEQHKLLTELLRVAEEEFNIKGEG